MKTIGWGLFIIPLLTQYRICFCLRRPLHRCVPGTGWKMIIQCTLRIILLVSWGMQFIDYSIPQTADKVIGVYVELGILGLQVAVGMVTVASGWFEKLFMLYPLLPVIPCCFIIDFVVKATCYGPLFLWPQVSAFGVFSLIEVWFRNFSQMYSWIAVISFLYFGKKKENPFDKADVDFKPKRKSMFSRSSTLSVRGRRSFLLKSKASRKDGLSSGVDIQLKTHNPPRSNTEFSESERITNTADTLSSFHEVGPPQSTLRPQSIGRTPTESRMKRTGGFVPILLRSKELAKNSPSNIAAIPNDEPLRSGDPSFFV